MASTTLFIFKKANAIKSLARLRLPFNSRTTSHCAHCSSRLYLQTKALCALNKHIIFATERAQQHSNKDHVLCVCVSGVLPNICIYIYICWLAIGIYIYLLRFPHRKRMRAYIYMLIMVDEIVQFDFALFSRFSRRGDDGK